MKTFLRTGALGLLLAGAAISFARAEPTAPGAETLFRATTLNLAAQGETKAAPDMAAIGLGVTAEGPTAAQALSDNAARMSRVLAALKAAGIADKDIRTSGLNLNAQYAYAQGQAPRLTGYQATNQVSVTVRNLARLGAAVDATVGAGADQVNGVTFGLADPTAAENTAREAAVRALQAKAELYARATGYRIARLVSLSEGGSSDGPRPPVPMMAMARAQKVETPVAPGELDIRIEIAGVYELTR
ncbi:SIMPL domain-containing protein [Phenylobacterium sp.]|uniref:SIMPL domain-containing protein n=1 Tax=Phenylobacterium sp. TaxID=1871053 RepID=UPI002E342818|nr:SIMPL domain-containing protein [Phenylobacterium sp.]HEX3363638.1 SIMPL domain-containing protein [Phenylobacterium sp.]